MKTSYGKVSDQNLRLWIEFSRLNLVITREIFRDFPQFDLSPSQFAVIEALYHKGDLSVGEVTRVILMTSGNLTVVVKNLEKCGLIEIRKGADRRKKILSITPRGREMVEQVFPLHLKRLDHLLNTYTDEEKSSLITLLRQGRKQMEQLPKENNQ
ncbi:MAG TPA: MarR family transcriptional regulator [Tissierellia bacterium]|nr:MarR family transcriptional regulator [Tissierellia bacterium]